MRPRGAFLSPIRVIPSDGTGSHPLPGWSGPGLAPYPGESRDYPGDEASDVRVLHIHRGVGHAGGGAGIAMHRLHRTLLRLGVDSKILALQDEGSGPDISPLPRIERLSLESRLRSVTGRIGLNDVHRLGSFQLDRHTFFQNADLVHFHVMHSGTFSYLAVPKAAASKPCALSLHDTWAFTGHCAYSYDCERWKTGCGDCPRPEEPPAISHDSTHLEWRMKSRAFMKAGLQLISKSGWTTRMARVSALRDLPLTEIPYGVDTGVYRPRGRARSRELLGLPQDRFVLLVSAQDLTSRRHGIDLMVRALQGLAPDLAARCVLLVIGKRGFELAHGAGLPVRDLGYLADGHLKAIAYSAADLYLFPVRAEVFGLASIESQACGTPVVSFRVGGVPEHVRPGETGFLAEPEDALGFRDGIALLLQNEAARLRMSGVCRASVLQDYDLSLEATRHADLYESILSRETGAGFPTPQLVPPYPEAPSGLSGERDPNTRQSAERVPVAPEFEAD
jgi:glycosyltransferase involved in cell wall biosynthesis